MTSSKLVKIPVAIGSQKFFIEANVVKNELLLLLSRQSMKRAEMIIDFSNDAVNVGGKTLLSSHVNHQVIIVYH